MKWISFDDKKPKQTERIIAYTPYDIFGEDHACIGNLDGLSQCRVCVNGKDCPAFTHWMPLPEEPTGMYGEN